MLINSIGVKNFRNLEEQKISTDKEIVVFEGLNGSGKTSVIEAIYFSITLSSFRTKNSDNIIKHKTVDATVKTEIEKDNLIYKIKSSVNKNNKSIEVNDEKLSDRKELIFKYPCMVFVNEDINFVLGSPKEKRKYFDQIISLCDKNYLNCLNSYSKILKHRNILIKNNKENFDIYNDQLSDLIVAIQNYRKKVTSEVNTLIKKYCEVFFKKGEQIKIEYQHNCKSYNRDEILYLLQFSKDNDIKYGSTQIGIHKDDFIYKKDNLIFEDVSSKGQTRILSLILRLAEIEYYYNITGIKPIILIDDILLELDINNRKRFFDSLKNYSQVFLTFLPSEEYFLNCKENMIIYNIKDGRIEEKE